LYLKETNLVFNSYAKLNLYLEVLNRRKDNYHNIKTVFERISLSDKIILKPRKDKSIKIISKDPSLPKDDSNLCYLSARLLQESLHTRRGVDIEIIKRIPIGAGLGGGSSNAAAVLLGLNKLWELNLSQNSLVRLAKRIGCDVPFFIYNTSFAQAQERGDRVRPLGMLKKVRLWHIMVVPKIKVSTPLIYKKWDAYSGLTPPFFTSQSYKKNKRAGLTKPGYNVRILNLALRKNDLSLIGKALFNDLERITTKLYPEVKRIKKRLADLGLGAILMSGSGPAVFAIVSSGKEAVSLSRQLKQEGRPWRIYVARTF